MRYFLTLVLLVSGSVLGISGPAAATNSNSYPSPVASLKRDFVSSNNDTLRKMVCESSFASYEEKKGSEFITTVQLKELVPCSDLEPLKKVLELEKNLISLIFKKFPQYRDKEAFEVEIEAIKSNMELLKLLEKFISREYLLFKARDREDENIILIKLFLKKANNNESNLYISDVDLISN